MRKVAALASLCDAKTVDYVTEAINEAVAELQLENTILSDRITAQRAEMEALIARIAELEGQSNSASGDDKYSLTKAKLVRLMKENGWYD